MIVRLGTAPRIDAFDFEGFQQHWRTSHADVVSHLPGLRRYQQFHAVLDGGRPLLPYPGFDACSALRFDTVEAMDAAFSSPAFLDAVQADEAEFVDKTYFRGVIGTWAPDGEMDLGTGGPIQVLTLLTAEPDTSPDQLARRLAQAAAGSGGSIIADRALHEGRFPLMADVVRVDAYADTAAALEGAAAIRGAAGPATTIGEHLARIVDVPLGAQGNGPEHERKHA